jgi:hypothetical protein
MPGTLNLLACIYLTVTAAVQRQQEAGQDLDAGLISITVPELLRLLRDSVIPAPRRDWVHRLGWSARRRRRGIAAAGALGPAAWAAASKTTTTLRAE